VIQEFTYQDGAAGPLAADGGGSSLEALDVNGDYNDPANWQASPLIGGTPGQPAIIRPVFGSMTYDGTQIRLRFQATSGQTYTVYWCDSLTTGSMDSADNHPRRRQHPNGRSSKLESCNDLLHGDFARRHKTARSRWRPAIDQVGRLTDPRQSPCKTVRRIDLHFFQFGCCRRRGWLSALSIDCRQAVAPIHGVSLSGCGLEAQTDLCSIVCHRAEDRADDGGLTGCPPD